MCLTEDELRRYLDGKMGEAEAAKIEEIDEHLAIERCPHCNEVCRAIEDAGGGKADDGLVAGMRIQQPPAPIAPRSRVVNSVPGDGSRTMVEAPGSLVGRYKLLEVIGKGGMGIVYLAEQSEPARRMVALKVIKAGMDSRQVIARFRAEQQALAMMDHPNIAKVLDFGTTEGGRPYFVMELVKGTPITRYCDDQKLTPRERLKLFIPVCQAVQHAHQKGVIHRDIKPSNVLVGLYDGNAVPKVIDFGVAKATGQELTEMSLFTGFGVVVGTPDYMSPEQARPDNIDIDTRCDVYSLGVLLYELLTGTTPLDRTRVKQATLLEVLRLIREEEPPRPSTRLSTTDELPSIAASRSIEPRKLPGLVRDDLDWVVMMALEKDRTRRYGTANALALDVERYLAGEPVEARPPSTLYRLQKFARKHRVALTTSSLLAVVLAATAVISIWQAIRVKQALTQVQDKQGKTKAALAAKSEALTEAKEQRKRAEEQRNRAEAHEQLAIDAVKKFGDVVTTSPELKNHPELDALRKALLKEPLEFYRKLRDRLQAKRDTRPEAVVELSAAIFNLANTNQEIGSIPDAISLYTESITILERLVHESPATAKLPKCQYILARAYNNLGNLLSTTDRLDDAAEKYRRAVATQERLVNEYPEVPGYQGFLAQYCNNAGLMMRTRGQLADAQAMNRRAIEILEQLAHDHPADTDYRSGLARSYNSLGFLLNITKQRAKALEKYRRAVEVQEQVERECPSVPDFRSDLARYIDDVGRVLSDIGQKTEALKTHRRALNIHEELAHRYPTATAYQEYLAWGIEAVGDLLSDMGQEAEALAAHRRALEIRKRLLRDHPNVTHYADDVARSREAVDHLLSVTGQPAVALESEVARNYVNLGVYLSATGRLADAVEAFRRAVEVNERVAQENPLVPDYQVNLAVTLNNLAMENRAQGRSEEAKKLLEQATKHVRKALALVPGHQRYRWHLSDLLHQLTHVYQESNRPMEALRAARESAELASDYPTGLYNAACALALTVPLVPSYQSQALAEEAVQRLKDAVAQGWNEAQQTARDPDFAAVHDRDDFRRVLMQLFDQGFPADPFAR